MQKNLVIVESPAKAKTIEKFLGDDFKVMSSYGHIRDLKKKEISIDMDTLQPSYEIPEEKVKVVKGIESDYYTEIMNSPLKEGDEILLPKAEKGTSLEDMINGSASMGGI